MPEFRSPTLQEILCSGADPRLALDEAGRNKYGCTPLPDPELAAFGSTTASSISLQGFEAAKRLYKKLDSAQAIAREARRIAGEFIELCGLADIAGLEVCLAPSGTDIHRIASEIADCNEALMVDECESGSGVSAALARNGKTAIFHVPVREKDGSPRNASTIDDDFSSLRGKNTLLVLTDVSKTGLVAPSPAFAEKFSYPVLVDACQFRMAKNTLADYLAQDFMVAVTGSKFLSGPAFSGFLLLPKYWATKMQKYAPEPGLLLRAEAALSELAAFTAIPEEKTIEFLSLFAEKVHARIALEPVFGGLPSPLPKRAGWDGMQTIFSFYLQDPVSGTPAGREQTQKIYRLLLEDLSATLGEPAAFRVQLGQPVSSGEISALRLSVSARLVAEGSKNPTAVIERADAALKKTRLIVDNWSMISG